MALIKNASFEVAIRNNISSFCFDCYCDPDHDPDPDPYPDPDPDTDPDY